MFKKQGYIGWILLVVIIFIGLWQTNVIEEHLAIDRGQQTLPTQSTRRSFVSPSSDFMPTVRSTPPPSSSMSLATPIATQNTSVDNKIDELKSMIILANSEIDQLKNRATSNEDGLNNLNNSYRQLYAKVNQQR